MLTRLNKTFLNAECPQYSACWPLTSHDLRWSKQAIQLPGKNFDTISPKYKLDAQASGHEHTVGPLACASSLYPTGDFEANSDTQNTQTTAQTPMKINWFPGHMHKARLQMKETLPRVDLLIEVLDARIPYSSENPMLAELRGEKPCLKILAKSDLADPEMTAEWQKYLEQTAGVKALAVTKKDIPSIRQLKRTITDMLPGKSAKKITTMVAGIPNVGKSTIINILAGKKVAKTGNEPAITKGQQRIHIGDGIYLLDTPGVLWPNVENINSGYRLALAGSVKDTAMEYVDVGFFGARYLLEKFPERLVDRYNFEETPENTEQAVEMLGRSRGCLGKSGVVDFDRASKILVTEIRAGLLGRITFETPDIMEREKYETAKLMEEQAEKKRLKDEKRKKAFRQKQRIERKAREHRRPK